MLASDKACAAPFYLTLDLIRVPLPLLGLRACSAVDTNELQPALQSSDTSTRSPPHLISKWPLACTAVVVASLCALPVAADVQHSQAKCKHLPDTFDTCIKRHSLPEEVLVQARPARACVFPALIGLKLQQTFKGDRPEVLVPSRSMRLCWDPACPAPFIRHAACRKSCAPSGCSLAVWCKHQQPLLMYVLMSQRWPTTQHRLTFCPGRHVFVMSQSSQTVRHRGHKRSCLTGLP